MHQISPYFQVLGHFWQSYECLSAENCKKAFFLVSFEICKCQFWLPTYSVKNCVYSFCLKHGLTFFFLILSRSFFIVNVLRHFRWHFMFGTTLSGKFDPTSKTAWWWRMVAAFNNVFHDSVDWMLTKSSLASVQCVIQSSEVELPFNLMSGTHSSSFLELIIN